MSPPLNTVLLFYYDKETGFGQKTYYVQLQRGVIVYPLHAYGPLLDPQSNQSAGPVRFLIFCLISIFLLASPVAGRRPQYTAGADKQGMYSTIPIHWNIKSAPASPGRSRVGSVFYVFSFLGWISPALQLYRGCFTVM
jgi:hypothetical protein